MRNTTYRYNSETCQYERAKVNVGNVLCYALGISVTAACMLFGALILHDYIVNTNLEKKLGKENQAYRQHHNILSASLNELQPILTSLQNKDRMLHYRFFGTQPIVKEENPASEEKGNILLADPIAFRSVISSVNDLSRHLIRQSVKANYYFNRKLADSIEQYKVARSLPARQPFESWHADMLISGFGLRINPFHKGLYEHLGIDIAAPRGTPVVATASGTVLEMKKSDLQAGYGNYLDIDHGNGIVTRYAHLQEITVRYGKKVGKGEVIGTVGTSGGSIAPHLHYEILRNGKNVDPVYYIIEGISSDQHDHLVSISHQQNQSLD
jgi:murein DD-endopeptidase MepM/ murein hydrolase activator NlpD